MLTELTRTGAARWWLRLRDWFVRNYVGAGPALNAVAMAAAAAVIGVSWADTYWPTAAGYLLSAGAVLLVLLAASYLLYRLLRLWLGKDLRWVYSLAVLIGASVEFFCRGAGEGYSARVIGVSIAFALTVWVCGASLWRLLRRRSLTLWLSGGISLALTVLWGAFLLGDGVQSSWLEEYLALEPCPDASESALEPSLGAGPWSVSMLDYGTEEGLPSDTVSLAAYMSRDAAGFTGDYAEHYLDYGLGSVPLVGRVWYPEGAENRPVLFIAHGNHEIAVDSYLGYDYLGEYLASHGYVVVSVDQNACNLLSGENDGRAVLLLEHIGLLLAYNRDSDNPLYGLLDEDNLAIAGHSRGGEMVATAYLFNQYDRYPENGTIRFDYHYNIRSLIAIAPTVNQYQPADHPVALEDVNYLLLHGASDRDVTNFMGMAQYENITFSGQGDYLKSALYIAGANHGQFNSLWGAYDKSAPFSALLNTESLLDQEEQQTIACLFIKTFLDVTLLGDDSCRTLLTDWDSYAAQLPDTVYMQCYQQSGTTILADFEEDSNLETATAEGVTLQASGTRTWTEELIDFANDTSYDTHALRLKVNASGSQYTVSLPETDLSGLSLTFDVCDMDTASVEEGTYQLVDFLVGLTDSQGRTAAARLSDFATVFPAIPIRTDKLDDLFQTSTFRQAFSTVTIPCESFYGEEGFDLNSVTAITFEFDQRGDVAIDNIGLSAR